jgi:hypothetical protein
VKVTDLYGDGSALYRTLRRGEGTGKPYSDCIVTIKVRVESNNKTLFTHKNELSTDIQTEECAVYDLEQYQIPAAIRKLIKQTRLYEIV